MSDSTPVFRPATKANGVSNWALGRTDHCLSACMTERENKSCVDRLIRIDALSTLPFAFDEYVATTMPSTRADKSMSGYRGAGLPCCGGIATSEFFETTAGNSLGRCSGDGSARVAFGARSSKAVTATSYGV